jgi:hypothetical protein
MPSAATDRSISSRTMGSAHSASIEKSFALASPPPFGDAAIYAQRLIIPAGAVVKDPLSSLASLLTQRRNSVALTDGSQKNP